MPPLIVPIDYRDPVAAFAPLANEPMAVLLDSAEPTAQGRFSYIAADPFRIIQSSAKPWRVTVDGRAVTDDPFAAVARTLREFKLGEFSQPSMSLPVPFGGGAIGFFSYELGGVLEQLPVPHPAFLPVDMIVGVYDVIAAFDHVTRSAWIISTGLPVSDPSARAIRAENRAQALLSRLGSDSLVDPPDGWDATWRQETSRAVHERKVAETIELIRAGDIFQANLTHRFIAAAPDGLDWFALYRRLRASAPAPFGAFFNAGDDMRLLSASPERFLALTNHGRVETRPIKGTRPRSKNAAEDTRLAAELRTSGKDRAENLMIVDLLRNDLARVCQPGSIAVPVLHRLESFPAVHHLVSVVTGQLRSGATAMDLLRACFPGGSVTGAPKIRAMEIIRQLEEGARGPYCGVLAWLGFDGAMDSSIVIRSLIGNGSHIYAQAGGGIVAESDPAQEYDESLTKITPLLAALTERPPT
ncbi:MAG: anthranilate synthase component I family protein [Rhodospirillaceae bacterium]|nr:MAG: anthranilate synthase component I family protein [Rhodospirillaceae bacterium]